MWRGSIALGEVAVPVALPGPRSAPDPQALEIARTVPAAYPHWRGLIEAALFEHYEPYADAVAAGAAPEESMPSIARPEDVWSHVAVEYVALIALAGSLCIEIGYRVAWDDEHALGARLRDGRLIELNGSVLRP